MLINDVGNGHDNWVSHARDLQVRYDTQHSDTRSTVKTKVKKYLEFEVFRRLNEYIIENRKLRLYTLLTTIFIFESYLDYMSKKFQVSAYNLQIETGRFSKNKTPRDECFCPYCKTLNTLEGEDEIHFLLACSLSNEMLGNFLQKFWCKKIQIFK